MPDVGESSSPTWLSEYESCSLMCLCIYFYNQYDACWTDVSSSCRELYCLFCAETLMPKALVKMLPTSHSGCQETHRSPIRSDRAEKPRAVPHTILVSTGLNLMSGLVV